MSADEYVPDERDFIDSWACAHVTPHDMTAGEAKDAARAFLARVRRDAARSALTAHANDERARSTRIDDKNRALSRLRSADAAELFRDRRYPEETP